MFWHGLHCTGDSIIGMYGTDGAVHAIEIKEAERLAH